MTGFVHLHTHTEYSLLDGAAAIKDLIAYVKELGMDSIAITDHGNMYGAVDFYQEARAQGIKPIIGCEVYMAPRSRFDKTGEVDRKTSHLILLAENQKGYQNLIAMVSEGFVHGFYYKPRIDFDLLKEHSEGIIALSACLAGEIPKALVADDYEGAKKIAQSYIEVLGKDNFFIELQDHGIQEQKTIIPSLIKLAKELGLKTVATNDIHYTRKEDAQYQDVLMCIQMEKTVDDPDRMKFQTEEFYLKSPEEMQTLFSYVPEALENTVEIAKRCQVDFDFDTRHLPTFDVPDGEDAFSYLERLCHEGLKKRYDSVTKDLTDRLDYELGVIKSMGFVDYFLIVWDFIRYAKENGVIVGPGRGSAAGSIVAYSLGITTVDPIKYGLIFERFLNPERVSMPDIDTDFEPAGRQKVIDYVIEKYGADKVAQIITFGTMKAKLAIRDVGRALAIPYAEVDKVAKLVPFALDMTIDKALSISKELSQMYEADPKIKRLIDTSRALEGLPRHASTHAAGVVITGEPIVNYVPLQTNNDIITTQFTKDTVEALGLLKMDFLGLRNLTIVDNAIRIIKETRGETIDIDAINYECPEVYELIASGNTDGIFQIESPGMRRFIQEMKPTCLEDIIAGIALYRPGPMDQIPRYIHNKNHPDEVTYKHPKLEPILNVTYGCMIYQEQVLEIVRELAGYSLGKADNLRRVISKKKAEAMKAERQNFIYGLKDEDGNVIIEGAIARGIDEMTAISIFDEIRDFANYAFNKSHAAAYSYITYQTAYLKTFYPIEFMAALISSVEDMTKVNEYVVNSKSMGIALLPPDVNQSSDSFTVEGTSIRFGLSAVKNVGRNFIVKIMEERKVGGIFKSFSDFCSRMADKELNKRAIEGLIRCGAFDSTGASRAQLLNVYERIIDAVMQSRRQNIAGQMSLFGDEMGTSAMEEIPLPNIAEYDKRMLLKMEKETIGMYLSGHPLEEYIDILPKVAGTTIGDILESANQEEDGTFSQGAAKVVDGEIVKVCGIITARKNKTTRSNTQMAFLSLEDLYGAIEVIVFPRTLTAYTAKLQEEQVVVIQGKVSMREEEEPKLLCESVSLIDELAIPDRKLYIKIASGKTLSDAKEELEKYPGSIPVYLYLEDKKQYVLSPKELWVRADEDALAGLKAVFGESAVIVK
jgi:DNA polymerase-3 subunit alpha